MCERYSITLADLLDINKEIGGPPMMLTRDGKSRMSSEQLIAEFVQDPTKRTPTPQGGYSTYYFITADDAKGGAWIDH